VSLYIPDNNQFRVYQPAKSDYSIGGRAIGPILSNDSLVYIGTEDNGLSILNLKDRSFIVYNQANSEIAFNNIHSLLIDSEDYLWIGTFTGGLSRTKLSNGYPGQFKTYTSSLQPEKLTSNNIYHLHEDAAGDILIGTHGGGLNKYIRKSDYFVQIGPDVLSNEIIWGFVVDDSCIWITTVSELFQLDKQDYSLINQIETGIRNIITLFKTSSGKLLIGTENKGIVIYDPLQKSFTSFTSRDILPDNTAYAFIEDQGGYWFSSNRGIHFASHSFDSIVTYSVNDGLPTNRFNYNSATKIDNWLYFGSTNGLLVYNKNYRDRPKETPKLNLTGIQILGQSDQPFQTNINALPAIKLGPHQRNFNIYFVALDYAKSERIEYAYRLENLEKEWRMNGSIRQASYSDLSPGNYIFHVCTVIDGELQDNLRSLHIKLSPFWWETLTFKLFLALSLMSTAAYIIWLVFRNKTANHQIEIERIEKKSLKEIQTSRLKFFTNVSHEFKTPLNLITGPIEYLTSGKNISNDKRKSYYNLIRKNADRLLLLINELIEFRKTESEQLRLNFETVHLKTYMSEMLQNFDILSESKNIRLLFNSQNSNAEIILDTTKFERIVFNLVSNAFNYTEENGLIEINHCIEEKCHIFNFRNTGGKIVDRDAPFLFDRFFSSGDANSKYSGSGIGLNYVKLLVELHKGSVELQSFPEVETSFLVKIPVDPEHSKATLQNEEISLAEESRAFVNERTD
jgi:signal transduction histidine kinase